MIKAQCAGFINTPPLWENKQFDVQQFEFPTLELHTFYPKAIPQNLRLGHQMEYVFKQLIEYSEAYEIVLYNLQINQAEKTLGEIDFILKDKTKDKLIHVELTYKFYIIDPEIPDPIRSLIGPNRRDSFFEKIEKIKNRQFPLLHSEAGAKALHDNNIDHSKLEHHCCFKAQLFQPFGKSPIDIGTLNKDCVVGYWLRFDDLNKPAFVNATFYMPTKSEWGIEPTDQLPWKSHKETMVDISEQLKQKRAPMIWLKKSNSDFEKLFVVWW